MRRAFFFYHSQCYFFTARVPTNVGIMFQLGFVFSTIKDTLKGLGENFSKQKKNSCEIDKVRKLSKHKRVAKNLFVWNFFCMISSVNTIIITIKYLRGD